MKPLTLTFDYPAAARTASRIKNGETVFVRIAGENFRLIANETPNAETMAAIDDRENDVGFNSADDAISFLRKRSHAKG